mmetsp:Transcript_76525/g.222285  ORF Transcript_76525/g.222285 Transcript_76525/m.222285 type:complete len:113 (+) Transcript_76525:75-413(+)
MGLVRPLWVLAALTWFLSDAHGSNSAVGHLRHQSPTSDQAAGTLRALLDKTERDLQDLTRRRNNWQDVCRMKRAGSQSHAECMHILQGMDTEIQSLKDRQVAYKEMLGHLDR